MPASKTATNMKSFMPRSRKSLGSALSYLSEKYTFVQRPDLAPFVNWGSNSSSPIHRWLRYREAYSPELIGALNLGKRILDPFCGCGSILVGSAQQRRQSLGLDINPLAEFAARVKLSPLSKTQIDRAQSFLDTVPRSISRVKTWPLPGLSISEKVFEPKILDTLLRLRRAIEMASAEDESLRDFLLLAWISILEAVGSYFKEGNGIKYRNKRRMPGRYEDRPDGEWQLKRFGSDQKQFVIEAFSKQLSTMLTDTHAWKSGAWRDQIVVRENALSMRRVAGRRRFDSIIFSPPYANRFDYFESMKVELWFGGFVNSYDELKSLRKESLRSHLGADLNRESYTFEVLESFIGRMDRNASSWRMGVADLLRGYFDDMRRVLQQCRELTPDGECHIVVGNSAFAGVIIPTDILIAMLGQQTGFENVEILEVRHLTVSPQQRAVLNGHSCHMRESVVTLR